MGVSKVIFYDEVLVDMTQVTVTPETLGKGATALNSKGDLITGTHECEVTEPKLQAKTVTPTTSLQTVNPDSGYDGLSKVTVNAMPTATQATPSITVSSAGLITASATQTAGYVAAGTKSATKQLTTQGAQTITPGTSNKTISSGRYLTGTQTIKGDSNLVAGNIKKGTSIFGVAGSYEGTAGEDVTAETNQYTSLLTSLESTIDSLPEGGGGSVETVNVPVTITAPSNAEYYITYATYDSSGLVGDGTGAVFGAITIDIASTGAFIITGLSDTLIETRSDNIFLVGIVGTLKLYMCLGGESGTITFAEPSGGGGPSPW